MEKATINNPGFKLQIAQLNFFFFPKARSYFVFCSRCQLCPEAHLCGTWLSRQLLLQVTGNRRGSGSTVSPFYPHTHTHTPIHEDEAKIVGAETRARVCVRELYSRSTRYVALGERGGICRCFYGGAGLHPGGICFTPTLRQLEGPVAEATDLNFKPIYK